MALEGRLLNSPLCELQASEELKWFTENYYFALNDTVLCSVGVLKCEDYDIRNNEKRNRVDRNETDGSDRNDDIKHNENRDSGTQAS
jgi:hypothetical protein